ncbi:hypothetical protein M3Y94_00042900 [Aphelenchoides besseyi]|nr:hypothetical protein M3Y94_00042900 [Aphelenchoides besseyi]
MLFGYLFLWFAIGTVGNAATLLDTKELDKFDPSNIHVVLVSAIACSEEHAKFGCTLVYAVEADLAHTYHLLIKKGIPSQNIIVFFTDSSHYANYSQPLNSLYNDLNFTKNWRPGLRVDYTARDVTSDNFLAVVQGNETALNCTSCTRRVLKTTKDDHIFIYHEGHGGPGFLVYPYSTDVLTAKSLHSALMSMQSNKKFNQLLINIMACHSGSMLKSFLSKNGRILGITAARPNENAWAKDCIMVNGSYDFCLNSEMGLAFNVDDTRGDPQHETLEVQYENVHKMVTKSHVMKYGSAAIPTELIAVFEGPNKISFDPTKQKTMIGITKQEPLPYCTYRFVLVVETSVSKSHIDGRSWSIATFIDDDGKGAKDNPKNDRKDGEEIDQNKQTGSSKEDNQLAVT